MKTRGRFRKRHGQCYEGRLAFNINTTPEIICDLFSFLGKDQIERIQLVNQFWNNVIIRHKNILPLRQFNGLDFQTNQIVICAAEKDRYTINFDGTNLSKGDVSSRYSQLTVDEVLKNLNDVVFDAIVIRIMNYGSKSRLDDSLNWIKLVTTKTGGRFRGTVGYTSADFGSKLAKIYGKEYLNTARYKIHPN